MEPPGYRQQSYLICDDLDKNYIPSVSCLECKYIDGYGLRAGYYNARCSKYNYLVRGPYPICNSIDSDFLCNNCMSLMSKTQLTCSKCGTTRTFPTIIIPKKPSLIKPNHIIFGILTIITTIFIPKICWLFPFICMACNTAIDTHENGRNWHIN